MKRFYISYVLFKSGYAVNSYGSFIYFTENNTLSDDDIKNIEKMANDKITDRFTNATVLSISNI